MPLASDRHRPTSTGHGYHQQQQHQQRQRRPSSYRSETTLTVDTARDYDNNDHDDPPLDDEYEYDNVVLPNSIKLYNVRSVRRLSPDARFMLEAPRRISRTNNNNDDRKKPGRSNNNNNARSGRGSTSRLGRLPNSSSFHFNDNDNEEEEEEDGPLRSIEHLKPFSHRKRYTNDDKSFLTPKCHTTTTSSSKNAVGTPSTAHTYDSITPSPAATTAGDKLVVFSFDRKAPSSSSSHYSSFSSNSKYHTPLPSALKKCPRFSPHTANENDNPNNNNNNSNNNDNHGRAFITPSPQSSNQHHHHPNHNPLERLSSRIKSLQSKGLMSSGPSRVRRRRRNGPTDDDDTNGSGGGGGRKFSSTRSILAPSNRNDDDNTNTNNNSTIRTAPSSRLLKSTVSSRARRTEPVGRWSDDEKENMAYVLSPDAKIGELQRQWRTIHDISSSSGGSGGGGAFAVTTSERSRNSKVEKDTIKEVEHAEEEDHHHHHQHHHRHDGSNVGTPISSTLATALRDEFDREEEKHTDVETLRTKDHREGDERLQLGMGDDELERFINDMVSLDLKPNHDTTAPNNNNSNNNRKEIINDSYDSITSQLLTPDSKISNDDGRRERLVDDRVECGDPVAYALSGDVRRIREDLGDDDDDDDGTGSERMGERIFGFGIGGGGPRSAFLRRARA